MHTRNYTMYLAQHEHNRAGEKVTASGISRHVSVQIKLSHVAGRGSLFTAAVCFSMPHILKRVFLFFLTGATLCEIKTHVPPLHCVLQSGNAKM